MINKVFFLIHLFDVVKLRFQELLFDANGIRLIRKYNINEGLGSCLHGFEAKVIRMSIGGAVCMTAFEGTCLAYHLDHWFDQSNRNKSY